MLIRMNSAEIMQAYDWMNLRETIENNIFHSGEQISMKQSFYVLWMQSLPGTTTHINLMLSLKLEFSKMESKVLI